MRRFQAAIGVWALSALRSDRIIRTADSMPPHSGQPLY
jgi:hypothetical protein